MQRVTSATTDGDAPAAGDEVAVGEGEARPGLLDFDFRFDPVAHARGARVVDRELHGEEAPREAVALPDERVLLEELPQGRSLEHRLKPKGPTIHAVRAGRWVLLLSTEPKSIPLFGRTTLPKNTLDSIFQAFEDVAR